MFKAIDISTSALVAQRMRMDTISGNIANAHTTRDAEGNLSPFQRRFVTFAADNKDDTRGAGVVGEVQVDDATPPRRKFEPGHPDADQDGFVSLPNFDMVTEFVNAMEANRAYEANVAAMDITKQMTQLGLKILG
ncbi:Flagellar basal-body rod protein FlgC [Polystyrenella longa]|uniref:Flagellar basal-body rod protein FlgC n=1 Tax=Polystyrenella longa TaxID=2528007 RepID=A0A518CIR4_9PLAN|nr:flagellar basal body rod protein FlgC [Polystyrenella longa]QDU79111.1 Flagellar basal-body rod protein FlgC [Polystyrenella longa]